MNLQIHGWFYFMWKSTKQHYLGWFPEVIFGGQQSMFFSFWEMAASKWSAAEYERKCLNRSIVAFPNHKRSWLRFLALDRGVCLPCSCVYKLAQDCLMHANGSIWFLTNSQPNSPSRTLSQPLFCQTTQLIQKLTWLECQINPSELPSTTLYWLL